MWRNHRLATPATQALPRRSQLLYSASSLGSEALIQSRTLWLVTFYKEAHDGRHLINPYVFAVLVPIAGVLNAFADPIVGYLSDKTRSRLGRRLPYILIFTPFWAFFGWLIFTPPNTGHLWVAVYFFFIFELYALTSTLSGGPYEAMLPEISHESNERLRIVGLKVWFGALGGLVGLVLSGVIRDRAGYAVMGLTMACFALTFRYLGMAGIWNYASRTTPPVELSFGNAVKETFRSRSFLRFLPSFVLFQLSYWLVVAMIPLFVQTILDVGKKEEGRWASALLVVAFVVVVLSIPWYRKAALRMPKRVLYRRAILAGAVIFPLIALTGLIPLIPDKVQAFVLVALAGVPIAGVYLFPAALTADIVDDDYLRTGMRREAMYFGAQNFVEKVVTSFGPLILILLLALGDSQGNTLGIRVVGPVAGVVLLGAYLSFRKYDLPDDPITAAARAAEGAAVQPAEGRTK